MTRAVATQESRGDREQCSLDGDCGSTVGDVATEEKSSEEGQDGQIAGLLQLVKRHACLRDWGGPTRRAAETTNNAASMATAVRRLAT